MTSTDFIAAWKDPAVRAHLSEHELSILPVNPAGRSPFEADPEIRAPADKCQARSAPSAASQA